MKKSELRERIVELIKASKTLDAYETRNRDTEALEYALNCIDYVESDITTNSKEVITLNLNGKGEVNPEAIKEIVQKLANGVMKNIQENKDDEETEERDIIQIMKENISALEEIRDCATSSLEKVAISREIRKSTELIHKVIVDCTRVELEVEKYTNTILEGESNE